MSDRAKVAAIIPAYNEEKTIAKVVEVIVSSPFIDEMIVVSDGSTDKTKEKAEGAGAVVLQLPEQGGKGQAMFHGLTHTKANIIVFFDADLKGLTHDHIDKLLQPVVSGSRCMNVGIRDKGTLMKNVTPHLPLIGGERAMLRQVMEGISPEYIQGFMVESALNYHCRVNGWPYGFVYLPGLSMRRKYEKVGMKKAVVEYFKMSMQVLNAMLAVRFARLMKKFP